MGEYNYMTFYYLASPYSHKDEVIKHKRKVAASNVIIKLMQQHIYAVSPIVHNTTLVDDWQSELDTNWDFWIDYDFAMLASCRSMLVLTIDGWKESVGVTAEIAYAKKLGKTIKYVNIEGEISK